jgi:hypothetical protein
MKNGASSIKSFFVNFKSVFTKPSFNNFVSLAEGWILCLGRHSISRVIQFMPDRDGQHTRFYDFFSRARWEPDDLSMHLVPIALELIPEEMTVEASVDDTLAYRSGAHIWGAGMHYDALRSNYGRGLKRVVSLAFGHSWVILSLLVPVPWNRSRLLAVPVLFRLYRSKKTCPDDEYRKRSELAAELVELLFRWMPSTRRLRVLGDDEYATKIVATRISALLRKAEVETRTGCRRSLPEKIELCGPMDMGAAFYDPPPPYDGRGRPRKKGSRLLSPQRLTADDTKPWEAKVVHIYGREVEVLTKTQVGLWYEVTGTCLVRMVVTRDPKERIDDRAYFITEATMTVEQILVSYSHRWCQEVLHRNLKQYFGLDDPQNGWWRHPAGQRRNDRRPGPAPHESRGAKAATRTVPFVLVVFATVEIWYLTHGHPADDVARARGRAPWNVEKCEPSFADMLAAARREILFPGLFHGTASTSGSVEMDLALVDLLLAA